MPTKRTMFSVNRQEDDARDGSFDPDQFFDYSELDSGAMFKTTLLTQDPDSKSPLSNHAQLLADTNISIDPSLESQPEIDGNPKESHSDVFSISQPNPRSIFEAKLGSQAFLMPVTTRTGLGGLGTPDSLQQSNDTQPSGETFDELYGRLDLKPKHAFTPSRTWLEIARQGILAAYSSRLNPYALHHDEFKILKSSITQKQVTIYLNIRNAILRLWHRAPLLPVSRQEAAGCARQARHMGLTQVAWEWLARHGYINFGCCAPPPAVDAHTPRKRIVKQQQVVVIGAGVSGLACARQLEALFIQLEDKFVALGQKRPTVLLVEGRQRIGGRVYSHPLLRSTNSTLPDGLRCTAEMGAQIIIGFEHGNPLNFIIRGQLALPYHQMRDDSVLFDHDGSKVDKQQDVKMEKLWNDVLERASVYRHKLPTMPTVSGDSEIIKYGKDVIERASDLTVTLEEMELAGIDVTFNDGNPISIHDKEAQTAATGIEKLAGRQYNLTVSSDEPKPTAVQFAKEVGYELKPGILDTDTIDLQDIAEESEFPTLGAALDEGICQYQKMANITEHDLRLLNWHHANLEYANATNVNDLSLTGWDQDVGNEFEGAHCEVIGGYLQFPQGLWKLPTTLDVKFKQEVTSIHEDASKSKVIVKCKGGQQFEGNRVVVTTPLGVLKANTIKFQPPLPDWKRDTIQRMGFGLLNKIVLVYKECFWEPTRDIFGTLNAPDQPSLDQSNYAKNRGRFYLFWNCLHTAGRPVLVALMAGDAAYTAESESKESLIQDVTTRLSKIFAPKQIPMPEEAIITRWSKDPFARGTYSYVGPKTQFGDYDRMAAPVGSKSNIHFAGEATCGSYPATVHGAYLSGLRAAEEIITSMLGPIQIPTPLIPPLPPKVDLAAEPRVKKRKGGYVTILEPVGKLDAFDASVKEQEEKIEYEQLLSSAIKSKVGPRPARPKASRFSASQLYQHDKWKSAKASLEDAGKGIDKASVRAEINRLWGIEHSQVKNSYEERLQQERDNTNALIAAHEVEVREWQMGCERFRDRYMRENPPPGSMGWRNIGKDRNGRILRARNSL